MTRSSLTASANEATHMDYEATVMHGKYSEELSEFVRVQSDKMKHENEVFQRKKSSNKTNSSIRHRCHQSITSIKKHICQYIGAEWVFLLLLGIIMALLSYAMDYTIQKCQRAHFWLYSELESFIILQYLAWVLFPLVFIVFSVAFVCLVSPQAIGSGIPEMKTIMRGVVLNEYLSFRVLVAKMIGLTSSLGSRLPIGKEGPFVHIASIVATLLNKFLISFTNTYENESWNCEMLAAACAVGVACNFAAPIGGVLFSIEVTATYFAVRNYWRGFFSAVCGALAFRLLAVWNSDEETITALFKTNFPVQFPYDLQELLAFVGIGIVSGFAGALFVYLHRQIVEFCREHKKVSAFLQRNRFIYPVIVSLVISSITYPRGLGQFMAGELTLKDALDTLFDNNTWTKLDLANESLTFTDVQTGWKHPSVNIFVTLAVFIVTHFVMIAVAITLPVPSGIFMPVFLMGAAFGRLVGESVAALYPDGFHSGKQIYRIVPGGYAVVGAASLSGAVTHTISTSVIVFELTGQISHILPVMIAVLISNAIAQWLQPSIYDSIILIKGLPYLPDVTASKRKLYDVFVQDFMIRDVKFVSYISTHEDVEKLLSECHFKTIPFVDSPESMVLIGSIQRNTLQIILEKHKIDKETACGDTQTVQHANKVLPINRSHSAADDLQDIVPQENLSGSAKEIPVTSDTNIFSDQVNFDSCKIDPSPFQLVEGTSLYKVHSLFSLLGLGHAYVTSVGRLVGVVSLKELRLAIQGTATDKRKARAKSSRMYYNNSSEELQMLRLDSNSSNNSSDFE